MKVAVVGAGVCGLSAARSLAERDHDVTLFEQFGFLHDKGSSHGRSRIVRRAYPDALYTMYMQDAYPLWTHLQEKSTLPILHEVGLVYFGSQESSEMQSMIKGLDELNVPFETLDRQSVKSVMPQLILEQGEIAVFTPEAGWVQAENALRAIHDLAVAAGAKMHFNSKAEREDLERNFDAFVICAGSWVKEFINLKVDVSKHTFCYFDGFVEGPVWIEDSPDNCYGFPSEPNAETFKIGVHRGGEPTQPDDPSRSPSPAAIQTATQAARVRFGIQYPQVVESKGCLYTSTENDDFRLGRLGSKGFYASACSGHGFKFGPWIGQLLAAFIEGRDRPERYTRFVHESAS